MKLTGNSLEQFEKWFRNSELIIEFTFLKWIKNKNIGIQFYSLPLSMQYGVLVDWFDSVGISIEILENTGNKWKGYINKEFKGVGYDSRPQAREKAIEQANEIYNKR